MASRLSRLTRCKEDIADIYRHAIHSIQPEKLIKNALIINDGILRVKGSGCNEEPLVVDLKKENIHVIGGGKSVLGMALGISELAAGIGVCDSFSHGLLSLPIGLKSQVDCKATNLLQSIDVECRFGSQNNLPDIDSVDASNQMLREISLACQKDKSEDRQSVFLVLISGGGSACMTSPKHISLEQKLNIIKFLVQKGADIVELNKVRRYFSNIKGGQLANEILRRNPTSRIISLIMSDVIGDPIEFIASGPTSRPKIHGDVRKSMMDVLTKYGYSIELEDSESLDNIVTCDRISNIVIGNNSIALQEAIRRANNLGYAIESLGSNISGYTHQVVSQICQRYRSWQDSSRKLLIICGGECTTQKLQGETWGLGGRAQEMALDYIITNIQGPPIDSRDIDVFLAGGTDGQDGPTDVAGCLSSYAEWQGEEGKTFSLEEALKAKSSHDSYNFWTKFKPEWLIKSGLTGTNVMDLYMLIIDRH